MLKSTHILILYRETRTPDYLIINTALKSHNNNN
jgi:hypothetical protein